MKLTHKLCVIFSISVKIIVFYVIYYIILAAISFGFYKMFETTLIDGRPKWIMDESLIGSSPGVGYRPKSDVDDSTLIWFNHENKEDMEPWLRKLDDAWTCKQYSLVYLFVVS